MTFSDPRWLWGLAALAPILALEFRAARRAENGVKRLVGERADHALLAQRLPGQRRTSALVRLGVLAFLVVGAAGPEWGREVVRRSATGSDVVLLVDVSASMDTRDVPPSRLEEARREALAVVDHLGGSRVAVVAFAGDAVRLCPLTLDRGAARLVLESLSSGSVSEPGSDLGRGLRMAARVLPGGRRTEQAIVLWTDGEDLEHGAQAATDELARAGLRVFAVGVGTPAGDIVPVLDDRGRATDVKRDEAGGPVRSRLDEPLLRALGRRTQGGYFTASRPGGELPRLAAALGTVARGGRGQRLVERPVPRFRWFALGAAVLLAFELARRRRREGDSAAASDGARLAAPSEPRAARAARATRAGRAAAIAVAVLALPGRADAQSAWARGDDAFKHARWSAAESLYARRAGRQGPPAVGVNRATALARLGKTAAAESALAQLSGAEGRVGQTASYNQGTLQAERRDYDDALRTLRQALERDPKDEDARFNYELALRRREEQRRGSPPPTPNPAPSQSAPRQQGPSPNPSPTAPRPQSNNPGPAPQTPPPPSGRDGQSGMDRSTAEQLLGSLNELERAEQQRMRKVRVVREKRGRDW